MKKERNLCLSLRATAESHAWDMIREAEEHKDAAVAFERQADGGGSHCNLERAHRVWYFAARYYSTAAYLFDLARDYDQARHYDEAAKNVEGMSSDAYQRFVDRSSECQEEERKERLEGKPLRRGLLLV